MPKDSIVPLSTMTVGPARTTKMSRAMAIQMLMFDSILMPLSRPAATEMHAMVVTTAMTMTWTSGENATPKSSDSPALICRVPSPTEVATPKMVPMSAMTSMVLPIGP